jgi:hypothetical protein
VEVAVTALAPIVGTAAACGAVGQPRSSWYRAHRRSSAPPRPPRPAPAPQPRALSPAERQQALEVLHAERFWDAAPAGVYAALLDEGVYLASVSTMYRLLRQQGGETGDRRRHATHPARVKPELLATKPNQVWGWDIERHEAPGNRERWETFSTRLSQQSGEAGGSPNRGTPGRVASSPDNDGTRRHDRTARARLARREGVREEPAAERLSRCDPPAPTRSMWAGWRRAPAPSSRGGELLGWFMSPVGRPR